MGGGQREVFCVIVEDDAALAQNVRAFLRVEWRLTSRIASSIAEARAALQEGLQPRMFVIDIGLPDGDGMTLAEEIRALFPHAPILIETGHRSREFLARAYRLDARYIEKPWTFPDLALFLDRATCTSSLDNRLFDVTAALASEHHLSTRERQYLALKMRHWSNTDIARKWGVKASAVESVPRSLLCKTEQPSVFALCRRAWLMVCEELEPSRAEPSRAEPSKPHANVGCPRG